MTTAEIESYANQDSAATADMNLLILLRLKIIPQFFADVGYVSWARRTSIVTVVAGEYSFLIPMGASAGSPNLQQDFRHLKAVYLGADLGKQLLYIGDDPRKVALSMLMAANIIAGTPPVVRSEPGGYFLVSLSSGTYIHFDASPDRTYNIAIVWDGMAQFPDMTTSVSLDLWIPKAYQWPLVSALRREIMRVRFGVGDDRYQVEDAEYNAGIARIAENPERARGSKPGYISR